MNACVYIVSQIRTGKKLNFLNSWDSGDETNINMDGEIQAKKRKLENGETKNEGSAYMVSKYNPSPATFDQIS